MAVMGFCCLRQALLVDVSAAWCRAELVELGAALPAAAAPACSILCWHGSDLPMTEGVSCPLVQWLKVCRVPFCSPVPSGLGGSHLETVGKPEGSGGGGTES